MQFYFEKFNRKCLCFCYSCVQLDCTGSEAKPGYFFTASSRLCRAIFSAVVNNMQHCCSSDCSTLASVYQANEDNRKRPLSPSLTCSDGCKTPDRVSVVNGLLDSDYMHWGVEETCQYLRGAGLAECEEAFKGWFSALEAVIDSFVLNQIVPRTTNT